MKISKQNLLKARRNSNIAKIIILATLIYLLMMLIKGVFLLTLYSNFTLFINFNNGTGKIIAYTYFFPINYIWNTIPDISLESLTTKQYFSYYIPPLVLFGCAYLFIDYHKVFKKRFLKLEAELDKEEYLNVRRKEKGLSPHDNVGGTIVIRENHDPFWHETWWGKIIIGLAIILFATAIGLRTMI